MSLKSDFRQFFFSWFNTCSPGAGAERPQGTKFGVNRKALSLFPFVASFKEISLKSDFIQLFSWFNTCIQLRGRGQNFDVKRKALSLYPFVASFKEISLKSDFIQFCSWFNTCIQPRGLKIGAQGQITPKWIIRSDPNSNFFELLCLSSLPASLTKTQSKVTEKK